MCGVRQDIYIMFEYLNNSNTPEALLKDSLVRGQFYYGCLHKTPFFSTPIQTLYFYIPVSGQLPLRTPFYSQLTRASPILNKLSQNFTLPFPFFKRLLQSDSTK